MWAKENKARARLEPQLKPNPTKIRRKSEHL